MIAFSEKGNFHVLNIFNIDNFLLFEHILCAGKYCGHKKIQLSDFDIFIRFEVSGVHLFYFYGYVSEHDNV